MNEKFLYIIRLGETFGIIEMHNDVYIIVEVWVLCLLLCLSLILIMKIKLESCICNGIVIKVREGMKYIHVS